MLQKHQPFSWKHEMEKALETEIKINKMWAKNKSNPEFNLLHPDWIRDAQNKNYTQLEKEVTANVMKKQAEAIERRKKLAGK